MLKRVLGREKGEYQTGSSCMDPGRREERPEDSTGDRARTAEEIQLSPEQESENGWWQGESRVRPTL